jgi:DNA-directed RNA polymerase specialized sigma24 family protein
MADLGREEELVRLLALLVRMQVGSQTQAVIELSKAGFGPSRIAEILGTSAGTVNVALSRAKTSRTRPGSAVRRLEEKMTDG